MSRESSRRRTSDKHIEGGGQRGGSRQTAVWASMSCSWIGVDPVAGPHRDGPAGQDRVEEHGGEAAVVPIPGVRARDGVAVHKRAGSRTTRARPRA